MDLLYAPTAPSSETQPLSTVHAYAIEEDNDDKPPLDVGYSVARRNSGIRVAEGVPVPAEHDLGLGLEMYGGGSGAGGYESLNCGSYGGAGARYMSRSNVTTVGSRDVRMYDGAEAPINIDAADRNAMVSQIDEEEGNREGLRHGRIKAQEERCKVKLAGEVAVRRVREGFEVSDPHRELVAEALSREGASRDGLIYGGETEGGVEERRERERKEEEELYGRSGEYKVGEYECEEYEVQEYKSIYE